jgi:hypothetical protein
MSEPALDCFCGKECLIVSAFESSIPLDSVMFRLRSKFVNAYGLVSNSTSSPAKLKAAAGRSTFSVTEPAACGRDGAAHPAFG